MKKFYKSLALALMLFFVSSNFIMSQQILCVDRDGSFEAPDVYTDDWQFLQPALDELGLSYEYFEVQDLTQDGPDQATMSDYQIVLWFTGEVWSNTQTMTDNDEFNLMLYLLLDNGKLLLSAQDYLYDRYPNNGTFNPGSFPYDALGCLEVVQDVWDIEPDTGNIVGVPGSFLDGLAITVSDIYTTETDDGLYIDNFIEHQGEDLMEVVFPEPTGIGAYYFDPGTHRVIFSTISYAAISDLEVRKEVLGRSFDWLIGTIGTNAQQIEKTDMLIYPNPATTSVQVGCKHKMDEMWIMNSTGQMVDHFMIGDNRIKINTASYSKGIYCVKVKTENGIKTSKLIVE
jgi:hypothetical protein